MSTKAIATQGAITLGMMFVLSRVANATGGEVASIIRGERSLSQRIGLLFGA